MDEPKPTRMQDEINQALRIAAWAKANGLLGPDGEPKRSSYHDLLEFWNAWQEHHYDPSVGSLHRLNLAERACIGDVPTAKADDQLAIEGREIISRRSYAVGDPTIGVSFNGKPPQQHDMLRPGEMVVIYGIQGSARRSAAEAAAKGGSDGQ